MHQNSHRLASGFTYQSEHCVGSDQLRAMLPDAGRVEVDGCGGTGGVAFAVAANKAAATQMATSMMVFTAPFMSLSL
jgi:hypothetical protein